MRTARAQCSEHASYDGALQAAKALRAQSASGCPALHVHRTLLIHGAAGPVAVSVPHAVLRGYGDGTVMKIGSARGACMAGAHHTSFVAFDALQEAAPAHRAYVPGVDDPAAWGAGQWWVQWSHGVCTLLYDARECASPEACPRDVPSAAPAPAAAAGAWYAGPCDAGDDAVTAARDAAAEAHRRRVADVLSAAGSAEGAPSFCAAPRGVAADVWTRITANLAQRAASLDEAHALACIVADAAPQVEDAAYLEFYAQRVVVTRAERDAIAASEQRGDDWFAHRACRWTGSRMAKAANMSDYNTSLPRLIREMLFPPKFSNAAMQHGVDNEPRALRVALTAQRASYVSTSGRAADGPWYDECGMVVHWTQPWIGGSPDMIVLAAQPTAIHAGAAARTDHDARLATAPTPLLDADLPTCVLRPAATAGAAYAAIGELKCPTRGRFYKGDLWSKADYAAQLHCNMACAGLRTSVFAQYVTRGAQRVQRVACDAAYWSALMNTARAAYFAHLLPRLVWKAAGVLDPATLLPVVPDLRVVTLEEGCTAAHAVDDDDGAGGADGDGAAAPPRIQRTEGSNFAHFLGT